MQSMKGKKAVNYWWGMSAKVIDVIYSQNGEIQCQEGESLTAEEIISMDWLAENVVGVIPEFEELTEEAQSLVRLQGVKAGESKDMEE